MGGVFYIVYMKSFFLKLLRHNSMHAKIERILKDYKEYKL